MKLIAGLCNALGRTIEVVGIDIAGRASRTQPRSGAGSFGRPLVKLIAGLHNTSVRTIEVVGVDIAGRASRVQPPSGAGHSERLWVKLTAGLCNAPLRTAEVVGMDIDERPEGDASPGAVASACPVAARASMRPDPDAALSMAGPGERFDRPPEGAP